MILASPKEQIPQQLLLAKSAGIDRTISEHTQRLLRVSDHVIKNLSFKNKRLEQDLRICCALHDIGKAASGFQKSLTPGKINYWGHRHEILSAALANNLGLRVELLLAIITHHRPLPSDGVNNIFKSLPPEEIPITGTEYNVYKQMAEEWKQNLELLKPQWSEICKKVGKD